MQEAKRQVLLPIVINVAFSELYRVRVDAPQQASDNGSNSFQDEFLNDCFYAALVAVRNYFSK